MCFFQIMAKSRTTVQTLINKTSWMHHIKQLSSTPQVKLAFFKLSMGFMATKYCFKFTKYIKLGLSGKLGMVDFFWYIIIGCWIII